MARKGENIFKRKDGRWEARYIHHYENGIAKYRYLYAPTYTEVKAKRLHELFKLSQTKPVPFKQSTTFSELAEKWLSHIQSTVKESTYTRYARIVRSYLCPHIKNMLVCKMDIPYIQQLTESLSKKGGVKGDPLAPKTVTDILCVLKAIFRYGQENSYPCINLSQIHTPKRKKSTKTILPEDIRLLIEHSTLQAQDTTGLGILLTLFTGLRIGEVCGLQWGDFNFKNQIVTIQRTVERISELTPNMPNKTKIVISEPKTENSIRTIPLPRFLSEHLLQFQKAPNTYFLTGTLHPTEPHQFYVRYQKYMDRLDIHGYTFHALRHTFATHCVSLGFDIKSLSEILGHANVSTTLAIYVHPTMEQKRKQMALLEPEHRA